MAEKYIKPHTMPTPGDLKDTSREDLDRAAEGARRARAALVASRAASQGAGDLQGE